MRMLSLQGAHSLSLLSLSLQMLMACLILSAWATHGADPYDTPGWLPSSMSAESPLPSRRAVCLQHKKNKCEVLDVARECLQAEALCPSMQAHLSSSCPGVSLMPRARLACDLYLTNCCVKFLVAPILMMAFNQRSYCCVCSWRDQELRAGNGACQLAGSSTAPSTALPAAGRFRALATMQHLGQHVSSSVC